MTRKRQNPEDRRKPRTSESGERTIWLFGLHSVDAALRNPARVKHRLVLTRNAAAKLMDAISDSGMRHEEVDTRRFTVPIDRGSVHQGAALEASPLPQRSLDSIVGDCRPGKPLIFLDRVTDPHNVGAIIRSAGAFGAAGVIAPARHSPPETGALAKSASGAIESVPYLRIGNLASAMEFMQRSGVLLAGFDSVAESSLSSGAAKLAGHPVGLVFGSEGAGLRARTMDTCDLLLRIGPSRGPVSLNVSNAAAVALHEFTDPEGSG